MFRLFQLKAIIFVVLLFLVTGVTTKYAVSFQENDDPVELRQSKKSRFKNPNNGKPKGAQSLLNTTYIWSGLGADGEISTNENWVGGVAPPSSGGSTLIFADPSVQSLVTNDMGVSLACGELVVDTANGSFAFGEGFGGNFNGTYLWASQSVLVTGGGSVVFYDGLIADTIELSSFSTLVFGDFNSFNDFFIQEFPLQVHGAGAFVARSWGHIQRDVVVESGVQLCLDGANLQIYDSAITVEGVLSVPGSGWLEGGGQTGRGSLLLQSIGDVSGNLFIDIGSVSGSGDLDVSETGLLGGTTDSIEVPVFVDLGGRVYGYSNYKQNAIIDGDLDPGDNSFGTVMFEDLELSGTSTTCIEVGPDAGTGAAISDRVVGDSASATADVSGKLVVAVASGFSPEPGDELFVFEDIAINGAFSEIVFVNATCEVEYGANFIRLHDFKPFSSPASLTVEVGSVESGAVSEVTVSDDQVLEIKQADLLPPFTDDGVRVVFDSTLAEIAPETLQLKLESTANTDGLIQVVECWDWETSSWLQVHQTSKTEKLGVDDLDSVISVDLTDNIDQFVNPTGQISTRVTYRKAPNGFVTQMPWAISIDQMTFGPLRQ